MKESLVSIVVPIYNVEQYLDRCVYSIVNQTYSNLQIILVDDGSLDSCPKKCDEWVDKDSRVSVIHKKNAGLGMARNSGIEIATGEYIFFIDSDDYLDQETIENCVKRAKEDSSDLVMYGVVNESSDGILSKQIPCVDRRVYDRKGIIEFLLPNLIASDTITGKQTSIGMSAWRFMYSMRVISEVKWRFVSEREIISEDYYSLLDLFYYINKVSIIKAGYYHYWVNTNSLSRSYKKDRYKKISDCHNAMIKLAKERSYPNEILSAINSQIFGSYIGTLKMIMDSNFGFQKTIREYNKIINDEYFKNYIKTIDVNKECVPRRILIECMKWRFTNAVYLIIKLRGH